MLMNNLMKKYFKNEYIENLIELPDKLKNIISNGYIEKNGCLFLKNLYEKQNEDLKNFSDKTGYECFVNKIFIDDYTENCLPSAISFSYFFLKKNPKHNIRIIISYDDLSCVWRFHKIRENENWINDNLENYQEEGILIIDTNDFK